MSYLEFNGVCSISSETGQFKTRSTNRNGNKKVILEVDNGAQIYEFDGESNATVVSKTSSSLPTCTESQSSTHEVNDSGNLVCKGRKDLKTPPSYGPLLLAFVNFIFYNVSLAFVFIYKYYWNDMDKVIWKWWWFFIIPSLCFGVGTFLSLILQSEYLRLKKKNVDNDDNFIFDCEQNAFDKKYDGLLAVVIIATVAGIVLISIPPIYCLVKKIKPE